MIHQFYSEEKNIKQHIGKQDEVIKRFKQEVFSQLSTVAWYVYLRDDRPSHWSVHKAKHFDWEWASLCGLFNVFRYSTYKGSMRNYDAWKEHIILAAYKLLKGEVLEGQTLRLWKQFQKWLGYDDAFIQKHLSVEAWDTTNSIGRKDS